MVSETKISIQEAEIEAKIQAVYDSLRILPVSKDNIDELLNMSPQELGRLTQSDCNERAYHLFSHNLVIQKRMNWLTAKKKWAENNVKYLCAREWNSYGNSYSKYEDIKYKIAIENGAVYQFMRLQSDCELEIDALSFVCARIQSVAETLNNLSYSKRQ